MRNYLILLIILNLLFFTMTIFIQINLFIKGIILGGMFVILGFQYICLKIKSK